MWNYNEAVEIIERYEASFDSSDKKRVNFVRQLAEADDEYYSVHALKIEFKDKTPTPPSKETEQSILYKTLNEKLVETRIHITMQSSEITIKDFVFIVILQTTW